MKDNLPNLTPERLDYFFDHSLDISGKDLGTQTIKEIRIQDLMLTLKGMQSFNYKYRNDDTNQLFKPLHKIFALHKGTDVTNLWLSMCLAIKELYGFRPEKLVNILKRTTVRKEQPNPREQYQEQTNE